MHRDDGGAIDPKAIMLKKYF